VNPCLLFQWKFPASLVWMFSGPIEWVPLLYMYISRMYVLWVDISFMSQILGQLRVSYRATIPITGGRPSLSWRWFFVPYTRILLFVFQRKSHPYFGCQAILKQDVCFSMHVCPMNIDIYLFMLLSLGQLCGSDRATIPITGGRPSLSWRFFLMWF